MPVTPWMTSDDLISNVELRISIPLSQNTYSNEDILTFANNEMMISQVPSVMQFHSEYFVVKKEVPLVDNVSRYAIPTRAIAGKLRDLFYVDTQGNLYEMTRIDSENRAYFQGTVINNNVTVTYYLEGNYVVMTPDVGVSAVGSLLFVYYLRPNQLVPNERAATIQTFSRTATITAASIVAGDTVTIGSAVFTAVASGAGADEFNIGTDSATASNLASAITTNGVATATALNSIATISYTSLDTDITSSNSAGIAIQVTQGIVFDSVPTFMVAGQSVDFLQTLPGHRTKGMDVLLQTGSVSGSTISFPTSDVPDDLIIGDYICLINECIIPQIPTDLHNSLAERTCAQVLISMGDQQGLQAVNQKLQEIEVRQGTLLDNRVASGPTRILNKGSILQRGRSRYWNF